MFALAISLLVAQLKGAIDMVKFGQTTEGKITYSVVGGSLGVLIIGSVWFSCKTLPVHNNASGSSSSTSTAFARATNKNDGPREFLFEETDMRLENNWVYCYGASQGIQYTNEARITGTADSPLGEGNKVNDYIIQLDVTKNIMTRVSCRSNTTVGQVKECLAEQLKIPISNLKLWVCNHQYLSNDLLLKKIDWSHEGSIALNRINLTIATD